MLFIYKKQKIEDEGYFDKAALRNIKCIHKLAHKIEKNYSFDQTMHNNFQLLTIYHHLDCNERLTRAYYDENVFEINKNREISYFNIYLKNPDYELQHGLYRKIMDDFEDDQEDYYSYDSFLNTIGLILGHFGIPLYSELGLKYIEERIKMLDLDHKELLKNFGNVVNNYIAKNFRP